MLNARTRAALDDAHQARIRSAGFVLGEALRSLFYFLSFLPAILLCSYFRLDHPFALLLSIVIGFYVAGILLMCLVVFTKRVLIGTLETNQVIAVDTSIGKRFYVASILNNLILSSPFRFMISALSPWVPYYYRGMGAKMAASVFISRSVRISDPWFLEIQRNATIGGDALILGHAGDGREIILGSTFIGEGAVIGARAILLPDVKIGRHARVGAGAIVVRGTVIPDGETWAGVPARPISSRRDRIATRAAV